jgi:hypothetical protein
VSCNFDISTVDYVSVSAQTQWQNAMWLRSTCWLYSLSCRSTAVWVLALRFCTPIGAFCIGLLWLLFCVHVAAFWSLKFERDLHCVCLCLTVCDLGNSRNSHHNPHVGCSTTQNSDTIYVQPFELQSASCCCSSKVWLFQSCVPFCRAHFGIRYLRRKQTYLQENTWQLR